MSAVPSKHSHYDSAISQPLGDARLSPPQNCPAFSEFLDRTYHLLLDSNSNHEEVGNALEQLFEGLYRRKLDSTDQEWMECIQQCRSHRLHSLLCEDPITCRAFTKPRGYAGDAELMDLMYVPEDRWPEPAASAIGASIYRYVSMQPAAEAVRARRSFIADLIDQTTRDVPGQQILAVAAGHLREAQLAAAVRRRRVERFVALDADVESLREVDRAYGCYGVQTVAAPVSELLTASLNLGRFDLIYSTGLFDYLNNSIGRRLVTTLFDMLTPGGKLVIANFMPGIRDVGYMEAIMDWRLVYRTRQDMVTITMGIPERNIRELTLFTDDSRNIIFLQVAKQLRVLKS